MNADPAAVKPTRVTAAHLDRMEQRRADLRAELGRIFPLGSRFVWELGCGHGHFLTAYAQAHPERLCVGVDIMSERIERAQRKRDRARLNNLHFVHADARLFLEVLPPGVLFSELFILFPDPWPKARHHKHRILQPGFLTESAAKGANDSRIAFRTDYAPYFEDAYRTIAGHADWTLSNDAWPFEFTTVFQSRAPEYQSLVARRARAPHL